MMQGSRLKPLTSSEGKNRCSRSRWNCEEPTPPVFESFDMTISSTLLLRKRRDWGRFPKRPRLLFGSSRQISPLIFRRRFCAQRRATAVHSGPGEYLPETRHPCRHRAIAFAANTKNHGKAPKFCEYRDSKAFPYRKIHYLFVVSALEVPRKAHDLRDSNRDCPGVNKQRPGPRLADGWLRARRADCPGGSCWSSLRRWRRCSWRAVRPRHWSVFRPPRRDSWSAAAAAAECSFAGPLRRPDSSASPPAGKRGEVPIGPAAGPARRVLGTIGTSPLFPLLVGVPGAKRGQVQFHHLGQSGLGTSPSQPALPWAVLD